MFASTGNSQKMLKKADKNGGKWSGNAHKMLTKLSRATGNVAHLPLSEK